MIAVIADDFTGAAEIAGIGLLYGLDVAIETNSLRGSNSDLVVLATDLRSSSPMEASKISASISRSLMAIKPTFTFKKIDSVLRGNIASEIQAQMEVSGKDKALLIPANPNLKRTIQDGIYYIGESRLTDSKFATDSRFRTATSDVVDILLKQGGEEVSCISPGDKLPEKGLMIGNTADLEDMKYWACQVHESMITAGSACFFEALLKKWFSKRKSYDQTPLNPLLYKLYVCGSSFPASRKAVKEALKHGHHVIGMPDEIFYAESVDPLAVRRWANAITEMYKSGTKEVIMAILQKPLEARLDPGLMKTAIAQAVRLIIENQKVDELLIEGGATTYAIMKELNCETLFPVNPIAPGVTRMRTDNFDNLKVTMKPGSYKWPSSIWKFN